MHQTVCAEQVGSIVVRLRASKLARTHSDFCFYPSAVEIVRHATPRPPPTKRSGISRHFRWSGKGPRNDKFTLESRRLKLFPPTLIPLAVTCACYRYRRLQASAPAILRGSRKGRRIPRPSLKVCKRFPDPNVWHLMFSRSGRWQGTRSRRWVCGRPCDRGHCRSCRPAFARLASSRSQSNALNIC